MPAGSIETGPGALLYQGGEFTPFAAPDVPPSADLRSMTLEAADGGAYEATLAFAGQFEQAKGTSQHLVFVSLQPPSGPRQRVILRADGTAGVDVAEGEAFQPAGPAEVSIDGPEVVLTVPADVGMTAEWEVQPHVFLFNDDGSGSHDHGPQVPVGALTGERDPSVVPASTTGAIVEVGQPAYWKLGRAFPAGFRPASYGVERTDGGHLVAVVAFERPPVDLGTYRGKDVLAQVVQLHLADDPQDRFGGLFVSYDVVSGASVVFDAAVPEAPEPLGAAAVEVVGNEVRFDLGPPGDGTEPAALVAAVPPDAGPITAQARATSNQAGCPSPVEFQVTMRIVDGQMQVEHADGDIASGPARDRGQVQLTSPGGRTYTFRTIDPKGERLVATHRFGGCAYTVVFTLPERLVGGGGAPQSPSPPPQEVVTLLPYLDTTSSQVIVSIYDQTGNGLTSYGPTFPIGLLAGPPLGAPPSSESPEATEGPVTGEPPVAQPPPEETGGGFPWAPVAGGVAGATALVVFIYNVTRKKGPCPPEELARLLARLQAARAAADQAQSEVDEAQNDVDTFNETVADAKKAGLGQGDDRQVEVERARLRARLEAARKAKDLADDDVRVAELALAACRCRPEIEAFQQAREEVRSAKESIGKGIEHKRDPLFRDTWAGAAGMFEDLERMGGLPPGKMDQVMPPANRDPATEATAARLEAAWARYRAAKAAMEACIGLPTGGGDASGGSDRPAERPGEDEPGPVVFPGGQGPPGDDGMEVM